jgi:hypothetical protein
VKRHQVIDSHTSSMGRQESRKGKQKIKSRPAHPQKIDIRSSIFKL